MRNLALLAALAGPLCACAGSADSMMRNASAGHVGCSKSEMQPHNTSEGGQPTWVVTCPSGRRYYCSASLDGYGNLRDTSCSPEG